MSQPSCIEVEAQGSVALLRMRRGKANAIEHQLLADLTTALDASGWARAIVLAGHGAFFSAGLDLPALVELDRASMRAFMTSFETTMLRLFETPAPVVAAIGGHAIAGGCVLALQADVRLAADGPALLGLNETQLGIGLPASALHPLRLVVPASAFAALALDGVLVPARRALELGLVDEVVPEAELLPRALERAARLAALPPAGVRQVKALSRRETAARIRAESEAELERWLDGWFADESRQRVLAAVERLRKR